MDGAVGGAGEELVWGFSMTWWKEDWEEFTYCPVPADHCTQWTGPPWPVRMAF